MHKTRDIKTVGQIAKGPNISLPAAAGVYAFWWVGDKSTLLSSNRRIVLKGPGGRAVDVTYEDWWPKQLTYPCLYIGKSTNIKKRFSQHIKRRSLGRLHAPIKGNAKAKPATTSCQLRFGIEHIFPLEADPLMIIYQNVGFSFNTSFAENAVAERFYEEDRLVGAWRPWFNIDSER
ncbi:hypothetical protein N9241_00360 [bacterium]|nr:hypothetical protein [bacterium]